MLIGENCYCWPLKRVWKKVASRGKVSEKSGNLDMDIEWQPCYIEPAHGGNKPFTESAYGGNKPYTESSHGGTKLTHSLLMVVTNLTQSPLI